MELPINLFYYYQILLLVHINNLKEYNMLNHKKNSSKDSKSS